MYPLNVVTLGQSRQQQADKVSPIKCYRFGPTFDIVNKGLGAAEEYGMMAGKMITRIILALIILLFPGFVD